MKTKGKAILRFFFETFWGPVIVWWAAALLNLAIWVVSPLAEGAEIESHAKTAESAERKVGDGSTSRPQGDGRAVGASLPNEGSTNSLDSGVSFVDNSPHLAK